MKRGKYHMNTTALRMMFFVLLSTVINIHAMDSGATEGSFDIQQVIDDYRDSLLELHKGNKSAFERAWQLRIFVWRSGELGSMMKEVVRRKKVGELETLRLILKNINNEFAAYCGYGVLHSPRAIDDLLSQPDLDEIVEQRRKKIEDQRIQKNGVPNPKIGITPKPNPKTGITFTKEVPCRQEFETNRVSNKYKLVCEVQS